jgi:hypothetical protein
MRIPKRIFAAVALLIALGAQPAPVAAQSAPSPDAVKAADKLFSLLSKDMLDQVAKQLTAALWPLVERDLQNKIDASTLIQLRAEFERIQASNLATVMKEAPAIYARHFTVAELRAHNFLSNLHRAEGVEGNAAGHGRIGRGDDAAHSRDPDAIDGKLQQNPA